ncbi:hypothetical protein [Angustibacter sp. Root456]|uniref:hypothetical protein n=1 Tax=Angustibacter sp. Root456 TaxID=1736539 RepID=UPI0012F88DA1|nr:hypothetical protein [Angustibacter sp. Root456]
MDAATMCDALSHVPGVEHVALEFDELGNGVLRVLVAGGQDHASVVGAAVSRVRDRFGLDGDGARLRLTGPTGRPVVAVVESLDADPALGAAVDEALDPVLRTLGEPLVPRPAPAAPSVPVQTQGPVGPSPEAATSARVVVDRVSVVTEQHEVLASVRLRQGERTHEGTARRPATGAGAHRALAEATAAAVEAVVDARARLDVDQVDLLQVGPDHVAVVVLTLLAPTGIDRLTGSALVRSDPQDAVVRATLDALNRRAGLTGGRDGTAR